MSPFSLTVSARGPFRRMAAEVAGKYIEMAGGAPAEVSAITRSVGATLDDLSAAAADDATLDLQFQPNGHGVTITVVSDRDRVVVRHPVMAKKG
ncbi:MAG TPA: hypothetical protein VMM93_03915 [Vicinamibacterales bacterium]|nr:hypothetical protein [Vicinamibacterales bacterium]